jgi:hypothetical protein
VAINAAQGSDPQFSGLDVLRHCERPRLILLPKRLSLIMNLTAGSRFPVVSYFAVFLASLRPLRELIDQEEPVSRQVAKNAKFRKDKLGPPIPSRYEWIES